MPIQRKKEEHFMNTGIYIPSIDARDIFLSSHRMGEPRGEYSLKLTDGQYDLQKFNSTIRNTGEKAFASKTPSTRIPQTSSTSHSAIA